MAATSGPVASVVIVVSFGSRARIERGAMKTFEFLSIIGSIATVGIALGAVVIGSNANLRTEMHDLRTEVHGLRTEVHSDIRAVEKRLSAVEQRQARTEGLLEGLRDAITARGLQDPQTRKEPT